MKRILCALLLSALLPLAGCGAGGKKADDVVLPPVRIAENFSRISLPAYTFEEAFDEADAVARIAIGNWLGEDLEDWATYYEAKVLQCFKGDLPEKITLAQDGDSSNTTIGYPLFTNGNEMLVFIKRGSAMKYGAEYWWLIGSYTTLFDVTYDNEGHRYYADRWRLLGRPLKALNSDSYAALQSQLRDYLERNDSLLYEICYEEYPYLYFFEEDYLTAQLTRR